MRRFFSKIILSIMTLTLLTGCIQGSLNVVVTNYPLEFLVKRIAGDRVNVVRLDEGTVAQRAQINSDYETILEQANVIFYINEAQPYFELYETELREAKAEMVDLSQYSKLYDFKRYQNIVVSGQVTSFESAYYDSALLDNVDMYSSDPILWIDPIAMTSMGRSVLDYLVTKYPDQATYFKDNFETLEIELVRLYADYQKLRDVDAQISFVTITPTFGNWQKSYGINIYPIALSKYGVLPDEALLNVYRNRIDEDGVEYIAYESNLPDDYVRLYNQIKTELDLTQINLHNLYTLSSEDIDNNEDYISLMYRNLETLMALGELDADEEDVDYP
ncbi:MAG TPA: zinc ABC transporter substrate-binding protein [Erysipelothrix sp.]|nr:zinc ABC transporter substrate-binding protein [Erysipelothrix sp.]